MTEVLSGKDFPYYDVFIVQPVASYLPLVFYCVLCFFTW